MADDPIELAMVALLERSGIPYTRPDRQPDNPNNMDFYLSEHDIYIEVKQFHSDRITKQLATIYERSTAIVLVGPDCVKDFEKICSMIGLNAQLVPDQTDRASD